MNPQTFIVSDESLNSYGMVIKTAGIDFTGFARNPVMYYMHDRTTGVIGRWENIRIDGSKLLMDAVFDDSSDLSRRIRQQVEQGFLRCASIGISDPSVKDEDGVQTIVSCRLREVSIVDIPANSNAVKLYNQKGIQVYSLADMYGEEPGGLREKILNLFGMDNSDAGDDESIISAIKHLLDDPLRADCEVSKAVTMGLIEEEDRAYHLAMARSDLPAFMSMMQHKEKARRAALDKKIDQAVQDARIHFCDRVVYERIAEVGGSALAEKAIDILPHYRSVVAMMKMHQDQEAGKAVRSNWGLKEYRQYAPEELRDNPKLYLSLMEQEGRHIPLVPETLDYYRRKHPEYIKAHPEEYRKVMRQIHEHKNR